VRSRGKRGNREEQREGGNRQGEVGIGEEKKE
jgi:hypothetical protein